MKRLILPILVFLALISTAAALNVSIMDINSTVLPLDSATYNVTLTSSSNQPDVVNINTDAGDWIVTPQTVTLPANASKSFVLTITPRTGRGLSNYRVPLTFSGIRSGESVQTSVLLTISVDLLVKGYPPNIQLQVTVPSTVDPRNQMKVDVFLKNNNLREYQGLIVALESDLFSDTITAPLEALSTFKKSFLFSLDPQQAPGLHNLSVEIRLPEDGKVIARDDSNYEVTGYASPSHSLQTVDKGFLKKVEVITSKNDGNKKVATTVTYNIPWFEDLFTKFDPQGTVQKDEQRMVVWDLTLQPQEEHTITLTKNYLPLFIIILAIIAIVILYFVLRSPIVALKEAQITGADEEGMSEMKVRLFVKNRSGKQIQKLKIIDRVPHIAEFMQHAHLGTLQPTKVTRSEKKGTLARWEIESLEPYEERIISYKIRSKLKIVGKMSLPEAKIKFEQVGGRQRVVTSGVSTPMKRA